MATRRTATCTIQDARQRLRTAQAYADVANLVLSESQRDEYLNVAAGLAVLAGIAASDAICCARLQRRHRGDDHRAAVDLISSAVPDGKTLAAQLVRLLDIKDSAHYGIQVVAPRSARDALKSAGRLINRARDEVER
jgi:hypothetical protein